MSPLPASTSTVPSTPLDHSIDNPSPNSIANSTANTPANISANTSANTSADTLPIALERIQNPARIEISQPLERVQVTDGLLITAAHWQQAHHYHRQYQSLQYQALHRSGIVQGLGVCVISAPDDISSEYRDNRWLQIQPGFAIDAWGHVIVVPDAMDFRLASEAPETGRATVSLVLRYVDPDQIQHPSGTRSAFIQETFRIDETLNPVDADEIVLCQVTIESGNLTLQPSQNVFAPNLQELDLRHRRSVGLRPQQVVQVETWVYPETSTINPWVALIDAMPGLLPTLSGQVKSRSQEITPDSIQADLLHLTLAQLVNLSAPSLNALQSILKTGTVLLVEASTEGSVIAQLGAMQFELHQTIAKLKSDPNAQGICQQLTEEWTALTQDLNQYLYLVQETLQTVLSSCDISFNLTPKEALQSQGLSGTIDRHHPLRHQPFLFDRFPTAKGHPLYLFNWGGILLAIGNLSQSWGLGTEESFETTSREVLRSQQEFGINLLQFAAQHRHLTQLQTPG